MRPALLRPSLVLSGVLGAAVLSGCSSSSTGSGSSAAPASPQLVLQAASDRTSSAGSAHFVLTSSSTVGGRAITVTADGVSDPAKRLGDITVHLGTDATQSIEERIVGDDLYIAVPGSTGTFYKLSTTDLVGTSLASGADPTAGLQALKAAGSGVTTIGKEQVRGASTTHYRGTYDAQTALAKVQGVAKQLLTASLKGADTSAVPFDAWIDGQGRIRRFVSVLTLTAAGQPVKATSTVEVYDFGTKVDVSAPPTAQVKDGAPIVAALKSAAGTG